MAADPADPRPRLERLLRPPTYAHSLAVRDHARALGPRFGVDPAAAARAGLLHDCAKNLPVDAYVPMAEAAGLEIFEAERASPKVLHQRLGARFAQRDFHVTEPAVLEAIRVHTTGHPDLGRLARCVLVADYTSPDRDYPGVEALRRVLWEATRPPEEAFRAVLRFKRDSVSARGLPEHPWAEAACARWLDGEPARPSSSSDH